MTTATAHIIVNNHPAAHLYQMECKNPAASQFGTRVESEPMFLTVEVTAMTRTSAAKAARKAGYDVRSVNMVG